MAKEEKIIIKPQSKKEEEEFVSKFITFSLIWTSYLFFFGSKILPICVIEKMSYKFANLVYKWMRKIDTHTLTLIYIF